MTLVIRAERTAIVTRRQRHLDAICAVLEQKLAASTGGDRPPAVAAAAPLGRTVGR